MTNPQAIKTPFNQTALIGTRWGLMLGLQCDPWQTGSLMMYGEWSKYESDTICSCLPVGGVALDVGANIGSLSVAMAKKVGQYGKVISFEPQRAAYALLCANSALTHCMTQIEAVRAAVSDYEGVIDVPIVDINKAFNIGGVRLADKGYDEATGLPKEPVMCLTLDSLELKRCDVLKIDVETMESRVLRGATKLLQSCRPVVFAEALAHVDNADEMKNCTDTIAILKEANYDVRVFSPDLYAPDNIRYCEDNIFPGKDINFCAIPNEKTKPDWFVALSAPEQ